MNILIIEDSVSKLDAVKSVISSAPSLPDNLTISSVTNLSEAVRAISVSPYDLIILDLMLPYINGGTAVAGAGLELLRQIRSIDGLSSHSIVVGLSAYPDELASARDSFERYGVLILHYDERSGWAEGLRRLCDDASSKLLPDEHLDFLIVTALAEERDGLRESGLLWGSSVIRNGLNVEFVELDLPVPRRGAVVLLRQMGLVASTLDTAVAIMTFKPTVVCMTGICAGISSEVELGQVILASPVWEYQAGKWSEDGFLIAPYQIPLRPGTKVLAEKILTRLKFEDLESGIPYDVTRPTQRRKPAIAPGVTGSAVIADSKRLEHIEQQHRKIAVIDMESFGVCYAAHESTTFVRHFFSIKTVVDLADKEKSDDLHEYGSMVSGRAAVAILKGIFARE